MNKKIKLAKVTRWVTAGAGILFANAALAVNYGGEYAANIQLGNEDAPNMVVSAVNVILGFLALVAVIMILIGGFKWMTAGGNEENVESAKKLLIAAIIGLVIVLAAWGISLWAVNTLGNVTGAEVN